jgi:2-polyprenyl-3-methyl-5-hydroxy-6-metoxy-1,4-benzoquinol methylase
MIKYLKNLRGSFKDTGSINSSTVQSFFNETQNLMFDDKTAALEQYAVIDIIKDIPNKRILDLGCGDGRYSDVIGAYEYYQGVDFANSFIDTCKNRAEKNFICADICNFAVEQKFNIVLLIGVITYLEDEDVRKLARNIKSMMLDDAVVVLRSVTLKDKGHKKSYYDSGKWSWIFRFLKPRYQIIRRTKEYELSLFDGLHPSSIVDIHETSYTLYTLEKV